MDVGWCIWFSGKWAKEPQKTIYGKVWRYIVGGTYLLTYLLTSLLPSFLPYLLTYLICNCLDDDHEGTGHTLIRYLLFRLFAHLFSLVHA